MRDVCESINHLLLSLHMSWQGGRLRGCVSETTSGFRFEIVTNGCKTYKDFARRDFDGSDEMCREAAKKWQREKCRENGWIYHPWRETELHGVVEVLLSNGGTMKLDKDDLPLLDNLRSIGCRTDICGVKYATTRVKGRYILIHRLLHPEWKRIDHINRNGLDNRRCNLRDGGNGLNSRNRRLHSNNTSGRNGISRSAKHPAWQVTWREEEKYRTRSFADSKYGGIENTFKSACLFRDQIDERLGITNGREPIQT